MPPKATTKPPTTKPPTKPPKNDKLSVHELSPLFKPTDFYYYQAQFPLGINFLRNVFSPIDNDPSMNGYDSVINFDVDNQKIDISNGSYSIPYELIEAKCNNPVQLYNDISSALYSYFNNEPLQNSDTSVYINDNIQSLNPTITIIDNCGNQHIYNSRDFNNDVSPNSEIHFVQDPYNYNYSGDVSLNYHNVPNMLYKDYRKYKTVILGDGNSKTFEVYGGGTGNANQTYYESLYSDNNENKLISNDPLNFTTNFSSCMTKNDIYNNCNDAFVVKLKDDSPDLLMKSIGSMSFNVVPNYSSINVYGVNKEDPTSQPTNPGPLIETLVLMIADYYLKLCENKKKAEIYQNLVNIESTNGSEELYQETVNKYYREYTRILNISIGIIVTTGIIYQFSNK
jgi:hypothetical protein